MSSPGDRSGSIRPADLFEDLWMQLKYCHQNTVQEFEAKVSKLKKDRCLDAQRLEVFYNRNQQLKEQNQSLQETIGLLEERVRPGECNRCAVLEEKLKSSQDHNLDVITKLKNEKKNLEDESRELRAELQRMKTSQCCVCISAEPEETSPPEPEEGVIPDSPILPSSLPVANKLRKRKPADKSQHVRYAETPLPQSSSSLFNELKKWPDDGGAKNSGREVLVPNTCELDTSQSSNDAKEETEEVVAETCGLELLGNHHRKTELPQNHQSSTKSTWKHNVRLRPFSSSSARIHSSDLTTDRSPSLLPCTKRFSEEGSFCRAKRRKQECDLGVQGGGEVGVDNQMEGKPLQPEIISQAITSVSNLGFKTEQLGNKGQSRQSETPNQKLTVSCEEPAFKKPLGKAEEQADERRRSLQDRNGLQKRLQPKDSEGQQTVEPMWSIDPALALSMYESEQREDEEVEEKLRPEELGDTDCTWVSHSLLQRRREDSQDMQSGLGDKANDSLDMLFDATSLGEYKSYNCSHLDQSQHCEEVKEDPNDKDLRETTGCHSRARQPTFAHVAVVRKKDERRKLKGTTCKECEVYYAHLPEEEKQKKLSACSRHRYLYVPPCTPENFWEVGFPSTQTCIERGYIREEKNPQARSRRRQPFNALFSPKRSQKRS
ncbi:DNA endonuclease RBBP8 isoform X2 [Girardinichthys multiradiatus]|uniref:DNA endonuclease RBBP8 isoform X2 n=1 Tax=Girardinichthys multiradiatus TaxID=208333 RepID=UPI001FAC6B34|nr:DNA endonuclease RBBP8 isoform X2 [Girardinichthys multiradiatus]